MNIEIQQLKQKIASMQYGEIHLSPPLKPDYIKTWEQTYKVSLPSDYATFITEVGDGGIVPNITPDCNNLISFRNYEHQGHSFAHIAEPFTLKNSWMPDWGDGIEGTNDEDIERLMEDRWNMIRSHGTITLMEDITDNYQRWFLVIKGPCFGEVWLETEFGVLRYPECTFSKWFSLLISGEWDAYANDQAEQERIKRLSSESYKQKSLAVLKRLHIIPNPPASIADVLEFEGLHHITFPKEYVEFITTVANGGKGRRFSYPKLYSLEELQCLTNLNEPFFIQSNSQLFNLIGNYRGSIAGRCDMPWSFLHEFLVDDGVQNNSPWIHSVLQHMNGCIPLFARPVSQNQGVLFLILNGDFAGEIWSANQFDLIPKPNHKLPSGEVINSMNFLMSYIDGGF